MNTSPSEDLFAAKAQARRAGLSARDALPAPTRAALARRLASEGLRICAGLPADAAVSLFVAMRSEPDLLPLAQALHARGRPLCLPVTQGRGRPLLFRRWAPGAPLVAAAFGVSEPPSSAPVATPALLFTPLAAFDRTGGRVGYGGGYYDRTLAQLRAQGQARAVGVAFSAQEIFAVPRERTDEKLDMIVTEIETIEIA